MLDVRNLSFAYGNHKRPQTVLDALTLRVADREFVAILGPSGCGKSTLLRIMAGFLRPTLGSVLHKGVEVDGPREDRTMMVQQNALFPWMTVAENVSYPLRIQGISEAEANNSAQEWLERISLAKFADFYPSQLSIGMQQRVAVARLFAGKATVLLMDEPFGALDTVTRIQAQQLLLEIWGEERRTVVFVTHDVEEALLLADRIVVLGANPPRLVEEYPVRWPRPREFDQVFAKDFVDARRMLLGLIGAR
jgi:NitT/TauT family transport system ATP-binding protein